MICNEIYLRFPLKFHNLFRMAEKEEEIMLLYAIHFTIHHNTQLTQIIVSGTELFFVSVAVIS